MASAKNDFKEFVRWLHLPTSRASSDVRRLANLILANFDTIQETSLQHSQRSVTLVKIARRSLSQAPDTLPDIPSTATNETWVWHRLHHLTVGPFRGFRYPEPFDLQQRILLFYGPNGSGKTSLCEAFEYALIGSVEEADANRIPQTTYLSNIHERKFESPILKAKDHKGNEISVTANPNTYRFCFIEKNRIDSFSRIAARPAAQRTELIATLFGMDKFNEFVRHFNESIDNQLSLTNTKEQFLEKKRASLVQYQMAVNNEAESIKTLNEEELAIAITYSEGMTYEGLKKLIGSTESPGRLRQLNDILNAVPPQVLNVTREELQTLYKKADAAQVELDTITSNLEKQATQISFKNLYTAVIALQPTESNNCPACDTPLNGSNHVLHNPYEKAAKGLEQLKFLAELQVKQSHTAEEVAEILITLKRRLETLYDFIASHGEQNTFLGRFLATLPKAITAVWWTSIYEANPDERIPTLENLLEVAQRIENQDNISRQSLEERQKNIDERDKLNEFQLLIQLQDNKRQQLIERVATARQQLGEFEKGNERLIGEVAQEAIDIQRDTLIKKAYDLFLLLLKQYRNQLPEKLMAGLNNRAMMLYNEFNRKDLDADKLAALYFPLTGEQKIEISFRNKPHARVDALNVLSEGHIRCLGLAILLAKSMSQAGPLIVFDDAINAIDHDHRRGIRETIFESEHFANTQIIVTCHSHEFIKDIHQSLPKSVRDDSKVFLFKNHNGNYHPRIKRDVKSRNYVEMARAAREELNDRGALDASRKALEMLTERVWCWLGSHDHGIIHVQLAGAGAEPALRHLCEALQKKIKSLTTFNHAHKPHIIAAFDEVLGIPEKNLVWTYLNKGTHEEADRDDFDSDEVEGVVITLEKLEALNIRPGH